MWSHMNLYYLSMIHILCPSALICLHHRKWSACNFLKKCLSIKCKFTYVFVFRFTLMYNPITSIQLKNYMILWNHEIMICLIWKVISQMWLILFYKAMNSNHIHTKFEGDWFTKKLDMVKKTFEEMISKFLFLELKIKLLKRLLYEMLLLSWFVNHIICNRGIWYSVSGHINKYSRKSYLFLLKSKHCCWQLADNCCCCCLFSTEI